MSHPEQEVLAAGRSLVDAFAMHEVDAYFSHFSPEATFIFHNLDRVLKSRAEYEEEWARWERHDGFRVLNCISSDPMVRVWCDTAIFSHTVTTDVAFGDDRMTNHERETIIFHRNADGRWIAIHEHLSVFPTESPKT
jgi:ketosteroid isomerase-like protein